MSVVQVIYYTSILSPVFALIVGKQRSILWYYAMVCLLADLVSFGLTQAKIRHSLCTNSFLLFEFLLLSSYFIYKLLTRKHYTYVIVGVIIISILYIFSTYRVYQIADTDIRAYNYSFGAYFYLIYIILSLLSMFTILQKAEEVHLAKSSDFFIAVGILIYASATILLLTFKNLLEKDNTALLSDYWFFLFLPANIIKNIFIAIGIHNANRRIK